MKVEIGKNYRIVKFHKNSDRAKDCQHFVGKVVKCIENDGCGSLICDPDNTFAIKFRDIKTGEEGYSCGVYLEEVNERKIITKSISYEGCIPEIADALKKGLAAGVKNGDDFVWVYYYDNESEEYFSRYEDGNYNGWLDKEHFTLQYEKKTETRVKKYEDILIWLKDNNWGKDLDVKFTTEMFRFCGKTPNKDYEWLPDWLEEVEV